jgi:hypothetical protein
MVGLLIISLLPPLLLRWSSKFSCSYFYYSSFIIPPHGLEAYGFGVVLVFTLVFFSDGAHDTHSEEIRQMQYFLSTFRTPLFASRPSKPGPVMGIIFA